MQKIAYGKIIIINGTSSAGKTTLAKALQTSLREPFCYYSSDQLAEAGFRSNISALTKQDERQCFFAGFHRSIAAFASAGNNLIVEHIVEEPEWAEDLTRILADFEVFWVGLYASNDELARRELIRGNRYVGESLFHLKTHQYCSYDIEIDSMLPLPVQVDRIQEAWQHHSPKLLSKH